MCTGQLFTIPPTTGLPARVQIQTKAPNFSAQNNRAATRQRKKIKKRLSFSTITQVTHYQNMTISHLALEIVFSKHLASSLAINRNLANNARAKKNEKKDLNASLPKRSDEPQRAHANFAKKKNQ